MGMPYQVLMPIFASNVLHGGPNLLGFLSGMAGVGALAGAVYLASRNSVLGLLEFIPIASGVFGLGLVLFSHSTIVWFSLLLMLPTGFGMMAQMASCNTILQTIVDDDKRGRVMSFYTMSFMGLAPFGSLLGGGLASAIGAPDTLLMGGISCLLGAVVFARELPELRKLVHPIYTQMGIIPQIASGMSSATDLNPPPDG